MLQRGKYIHNQLKAGKYFPIALPNMRNANGCECQGVMVPYLFKLAAVRLA
jgi:hypothetical protein